MVSAPARGYRLAPAEERAKRYERGLEAVGRGEHDLRTALRQALSTVYSKLSNLHGRDFPQLDIEIVEIPDLIEPSQPIFPTPNVRAE